MACRALGLGLDSEWFRVLGLRVLYGDAERGQLRGSSLPADAPIMMYQGDEDLRRGVCMS